MMSPAYIATGSFFFSPVNVTSYWSLTSVQGEGKETSRWSRLKKVQLQRARAKFKNPYQSYKQQMAPQVKSGYHVHPMPPWSFSEPRSSPTTTLSCSYSFLKLLVLKLGITLFILVCLKLRVHFIKNRLHNNLWYGCLKMVNVIRPHLPTSMGDDKQLGPSHQNTSCFLQCSLISFVSS